MTDAPFDNDLAEGPANGRAFWCLAEDGVRLRLGLWSPEAKCKGTILLFSGRSECLEKYGRTATELVARGFAVLIIDWRGQGLSDRLTQDRMQGHIARFADYQEDVAAMVQAAHDLKLPHPWHLLGHSMGACIGLRALHEGLSVSSCAFTAPMWGIRMTAAQRMLAWPVSWLAQALGKGHNYIPDKTGSNRTSYVLNTRFEDNCLTQGADMYAYLVRLAENLPDRLIGGATLGWLYAALTECRALGRMPAPDIPVLVLTAGRDEVVDNSVITARLRNWHGARSGHLPDAMHDILSERTEIRSRALSDICGFFAAHTKTAPPTG